MNNNADFLEVPKNEAKLCTFRNLVMKFTIEH